MRHRTHGRFVCDNCGLSEHVSEMRTRAAAYLDFRMGVWFEEFHPQEVVSGVDVRAQMRSREVEIA
jgi:hypothetical protein